MIERIQSLVFTPISFNNQTVGILMELRAASVIEI